MTEYIISCSGCGKRYKGTASSKKFKCSSCGYLFTFPNGPRAPSVGNVMCAHCWTECPGHAHAFPCPGCQQAIHPLYSARAVAWAAGSSLTPSVEDEASDLIQRQDSANERLREIEAKLSKAQNRVDELQTERDRAIAQINQKQMEVVQLRTEFQQYRTIAVQALEPIGDEFTQRSRKLLERLDSIAKQAQALREEFVVRIEKLESDVTQARQQMHGMVNDINTRLASVLGTPKPVLDEPAVKQAPPPARAVELPKGELTMTQAMNDLLAANGYAKHTPLTPLKKAGK